MILRDTTERERETDGERNFGIFIGHGGKEYKNAVCNNKWVKSMMIFEQHFCFVSVLSLQRSPLPDDSFVVFNTKLNPSTPNLTLVNSCICICQLSLNCPLPRAELAGKSTRTPGW